MGTIALRTIGRFGNQMFQYAFARAYAERYGLTLELEPCLIQRVFDIDHPPVSRDWPVKSTAELNFGEKDFTLTDYCTIQKNLIYTRSQARKWFLFRHTLGPSVIRLKTYHTVCHERRGDYFGAGYVVVSRRSYMEMLSKLQYQDQEPHFCSDEGGHPNDAFPKELQFLPDFWLMLYARVLLRGNSSFSWWAATLGHGIVYSPVIDGLKGGQEHDCPFTQGNHPKFICNGEMTDLTLME